MGETLSKLPAAERGKGTLLVKMAEPSTYPMSPILTLVITVSRQ